jgi:hypothetical protein
MWIVAIDAKIKGFGTIPVSSPPTVNAVPPVSILGAVTFSAKEIRLIKRNYLPIAQGNKIIAIIRMMTVKAPNHFPAVIQFYILVDQKIFSSLEIYREIFLRPMARSAWSDGLGQFLEWNREVLFGPGWTRLRGCIRIIYRLGNHAFASEIGTQHQIHNNQQEKKTLCDAKPS